MRFSQKEIEQIKLDKMTPEESAVYQLALDTRGQWVSIKQAAKLLGKHQKTIMRWIERDDVRIVWDKLGDDDNSPIIIHIGTLRNLYAQLERGKNHERI